MTPKKIFALTVAILIGFVLTWATELSEGYHTLKVIIALTSPVSAGYSMDWLVEYQQWEYKYDGYTIIITSLFLFLAGWVAYRLLASKDTRLLQIGFTVVMLNAAISILLIILTFTSKTTTTALLTTGIIIGRCLWMHVSFKALQAIRRWPAATIIHQSDDNESGGTIINAYTTDRVIHLLTDMLLIYCLMRYLDRIALNNTFIAPYINKLIEQYHYYRIWPAFIFFPALRIVYYLFFEYLLAITPGKLITGGYVVKNKGGNITFLQACCRTFARLLPCNTISFMMDGWHDVLSKSRVVKARKEKHFFIWLLAVAAIIVAGQFTGNKLTRALCTHEKAVNDNLITQLQYTGIKEELKQLDTACYFWVESLDDYELNNIYKVAAIEADSILFHVYNTNDFTQGKSNHQNFAISKQVLKQYFSGFELWKKGLNLTEKKKKHIIASVHPTGRPEIYARPVGKDWDKPGWFYMRLHVKNRQPGKIQMFVQEGQAIEKNIASSKEKLPADYRLRCLDINFKRNDKGVFKACIVFNTTDGNKHKFLVTNIPETESDGGFTHFNRMYE